MHYRTKLAVPALAAAVGLAVGAVAAAGPAQADPVSDAFLNAVSTAGVGTLNPATAIELGKSVCPMLSEPGQTAADAAAKVADATGMSLGGANLFTGIAISMFCPAIVGSIGNGAPPIPIPLPGF